MAVAYYSRKTQGQMTLYTRTGEGTYLDENGVEQTAPSNTLRLNHDENGKLLGVKFGDGDTMYMPSQINEAWIDENSPGTLFVMGQAPNGVEWFRCGDISITGVLATKLHVIQLSDVDVSTLDPTMYVFPDAPVSDGDCHFLLAKYYSDDITLPEEYDMMVELNTFMHGDWN